ncbi:MAG: hypothetical protein F6K42_00040 [Leptolyngbya sp. SIO1D8]|nr:hypothetical protein [Leptolyngbya sp. SIO1D8]
MAGFGDLIQKAFYLGVGAASYAGEKAGGSLKDLRAQSQKIVDELVERGELTAEEAQQLFNKMMQQTQATTDSVTNTHHPEGPRKIEILDEDDEDISSEEAKEAEALRQQVDSLRQQLEALKRKGSQ